MKTFLVIFFISLSTFVQSAPLRITITEGVIEPLPYAAPTFIGETGASNELANKIANLFKLKIIKPIKKSDIIFEA